MPQEPIFMIFDLSIDQLKPWEEHFMNARKAKGKWILVSPIQLFENYNSNWWSHYQPLKYELTLKTMSKLKCLCQLAREYGLNIMIDVVWNQTSLTVYTEATKYRYHEERIAEPNVLYPQEILSRLWQSSGLPDLKTELQEIKDEAITAVRQMRQCGVKGFRIDSAIWIDGDFFNDVFADSPPDELHLYEVFVREYIPSYLEWMDQRRKNDPANVIFYWFRTYYEINDTLNAFLNGTVSSFELQFFPSQDLMMSVLDYDIIQFAQQNNLYNLFQYFLILLYLQDTSYFMYTIVSYENSPNIPFQQSCLFNWFNYFQQVVPVLRSKKHTGVSVGTLSTFFYPDTDLSNTLPLLIGKRNETDCLLVNFKSTFSNSVSSIPCTDLYPRWSAQSKLYGLLSQQLLTDLNYANGYIYCPENAYTIIRQVDLK